MAITIEEAIKKLLITGLYPCGPKREQGTKGYKVVLKKKSQIYLIVLNLACSLKMNINTN